MGKASVLNPEPSVLIESLRDIGYSVDTAIADIVDNSISAGAEKIAITMLSDKAGRLFVEIRDDGQGLTKDRLFEAMRLGSTNPRRARSVGDLGRFGLGLKTASFSQCRKLSVCSKGQGECSSFVWDLDHVVETNQWEVLEGSTGLLDGIESGTVVRWDNIDRIYLSDKHPLGEVVDRVASHLSLVFHRFLSGATGIQRVMISMNGRDLEALDPFNSMHPRTIAAPVETMGDGVVIQSFTLPHKKDYEKEAEYDRYSLGSYLKHQGVYLYRANRLIIYGSWFRVVPSTALTQLCRVRIDIDNNQDESWKIDVKKNHAELPPAVRSRLKELARQGGAVQGSKRKMKRHAAAVISEQAMPLWKKLKDPDTHETVYRIDREHPLVSQVLKDGGLEARALLELVEATLPVEDVALEAASNPDSVAAFKPEGKTRANLAKALVESFVASGLPYGVAVEKVTTNPLFDDLDISNVI